MSEEMKLVYVLVGVLIASGLLVYLTHTTTAEPDDAFPVRKKKHKKKKRWQYRHFPPGREDVPERGGNSRRPSRFPDESDPVES